MPTNLPERKPPGRPAINWLTVALIAGIMSAASSAYFTLVRESKHPAATSSNPQPPSPLKQ